MKITKKILGLSAVAAVAFACTMPANAGTQQSGAMNDKMNGKVKCYGVNRCKGKSACACAKSKCKSTNKCKGMQANKCKGMNACKGKGWVWKKSEKACLKKGGSVTPPAKH